MIGKGQKNQYNTTSHNNSVQSTDGCFPKIHQKKLEKENGTMLPLTNTFMTSTQNMMWQPILKKDMSKGVSNSHAATLVNSNQNSARGSDMRRDGSKDYKGNNANPSRRLYAGNSLTRAGSENGNKVVKTSSMDRPKDFAQTMVF
jgi:hypothetical protein